MKGIFFCIVLTFSFLEGILGQAQVQQEQGLEKVSIYLAWTHQFQFAGYYAAKELGYYRDVGLDVELIPGAHVNNVEAVLAGDYTYGVGTGGLLLSNPRANEVTVLAAIMQQSPVTLLTLNSNEVEMLTDLEGKDISGGIEIKLMLASAGVDISKVNFGALISDIDNLISGRFDAIAYYITDKTNELVRDSLAIRTFRPIEYGINFYGECLFTSRQEVENNPERVRSIRSATIKGWEYVVANPEQAIEIILENYPSGMTREELEMEADITIHSLMQPLNHDIGDMQFSKWNQMADRMISFGIIEEKPDLAGFIYNPTVTADPGALRFLRILLIVLGAGGVILIGLVVYNRQLQKAVSHRTEKLQKINNELDRFVYSVSHDIKSPLSSMQGVVNLMKSDPEGQEKYLQLMESSIHQLTNFTSEILDFSKNSRTEIEYAPVDVSKLIESEIDGLKYLDEGDKIKFITEFGNNGTINTDEWRLKTIISNLVSNAIKYHDSAKESSYVKIKTWSDNRQLHIELEDNGIGIESQHLDKIYDMFYRATTSSKGSGLGLYIVLETIKMLKGDIKINSEHGEGTRISLKIPVSTDGKK